MCVDFFALNIYAGISLKCIRYSFDKVDGNNYHSLSGELLMKNVSAWF